MKCDTDVIIIGAGPTGLMLANILGIAGVNVVLIEARTELIDFPRAVGIDDEALRAMQSIGLIDKVLPHTTPDQKVVVINKKGRVISQMAPTTREFGWPRRNGFVQPLVDAVLLEGLDRFPHVDIRFGAKAVDLGWDDEKAVVTVQSDDGKPFDLTSKYLIGCEGGRSLTRARLDVRFDGETMPDRMLVIDVANDPLGTPNVVFGADPARGFGSISMPHGIRRWEFMLTEEESDERAISDEFVHGLLTKHVTDPASLNIIRRRVYSHNARIASRFRRGRAIIAGDAAHIMPTFAGQGWNSCIRDALNLGWKVAAVVGGTAADSLLDTYEIERRGHVEEIIQLSVGMSKLFATRSRLKSAVRDGAAAVVEQVPPLRSWLSRGAFKPMPVFTQGAIVVAEPPQSKSVPRRKEDRGAVGRLFPQPRVSTLGNSDILLDDATGAGWRVIVWNNDPARFLSRQTMETLTQIDARLIEVVPSVQLPWAVQNVSEGVTAVGDTTGALQTWFDGSSCSAFIVRPDHIVAAECDAQHLDSMLCEVFAAVGVKRRVTVDALVA